MRVFALRRALFGALLLTTAGNVTDGTTANLDKAALAGRPAIVDFIFTRCPASCPRLTARMKELELKIPQSSTVRLLSITVDPEHDGIAELTRYAEG